MLGFGALGEGPLGAPDDDTIGGGGGGGGGGPQQPYGTHRYWRFTPLQANDNNFVFIPELEFRSEPGGTAITGTPISGGSVWAGNVVANAFDGDTSTHFEAGGVHDGTGVVWAGLDFGTGVSVVEVVTSGTDGGGERPTLAQVDYSDNGTTWTTAWTVGYWTRLIGTNLSTSPDWDWSAAAGTHLYWRVRTLTNIATAFTGWYTIEFRETVGGAAVNTGMMIAGDEGAGFDSGQGGDLAFDGDDTTFANIANNDGVDKTWLGRHFDVPRAIAQVRLVRPATGSNRATSVAIEYSDTGAFGSWTTAWSISWPDTDPATLTSDNPGGTLSVLTLDAAATVAIAMQSLTLISPTRFNFPLSTATAIVISEQDVTLFTTAPINHFSVDFRPVEAITIAMQDVTLFYSVFTLQLTAATAVVVAPQSILLVGPPPPMEVTISEVFTIGSALTPTRVWNLSDTLSVSTAISAQTVWTVIEHLTITHTVRPTTTFAMALDEQLTIAAALRRADVATLTETLNLSAVMTGVQAVQLLERLVIAPVMRPTTSFAMNIVEALKLSQPLALLMGAGDLSDNLVIADSITAQLRAGVIITEHLDVSLTDTHQLIVSATLDETLELTHSQLLTMIYGGDLADLLQLDAAYVSPGGTIATWCLNTRTSSVTEYQNYEFNSFAQMGHKYLGASSSGLYELDGDNDNGTDIIWTIKNGLTQFNGSRFNGFKAIYLAVRGEGDYVLRMQTADGKEFGYKVRAHDGATTKIPVGKGLRARYWSFELTGIGSRSELDNLEFVPLRMNRRV